MSDKVEVEYDQNGYWIDAATGQRIFPESQAWSVGVQQQVRSALDEFAIAIGHIYGMFDEERTKNFDDAKERLNREKKSAVSVCLARVEAITTQGDSDANR